MQLLAFLSIISTAAAILLPQPDGPYQVSVAVKALTDQSRIDPYSPKDNRHKRQVVVSLFLPVDDKIPTIKNTIPYMTPPVAQDYGVLLANAVGLPNRTFTAFEVKTSVVKAEASCGSKKSMPANKTIPLLLFSPGFGDSRLLYSTMARSLASEGYAVVTIDHPYDASSVQFPDGKVVKAVNISETDFPALTKLTQVRADDVSFVLDQVKDPKVFRKEFVAHDLAIDFKRVLMYGHSLGGATAALAMLTDPRIRGGVNMDGLFLGSVKTKGLSRPFVLLGRPDHIAVDPTWPQVFAKLRGSRFEMFVADTMHTSFTDYPVLIDSLHLPEGERERVAILLGAASGRQMDKVVKGVITAFSEFVFGEERAPAVLKENQKEIAGLTVAQSDIRK